MNLEEAIKILKDQSERIKQLIPKPDFVGVAINTVVSELEKPTYTADEMYLNMQYYMEYCLMKGYVTPMKWLEKYKHFGKEAAIRDKASQVGKEATE